MSSFAANILYKTVLRSRITQTKETTVGLPASLTFFGFKALSCMLTDFLLHLSFCHTLIVALLACPLFYLLALVGFCWIDRSHGNIDWPRVPWGWEFSDCHRWEQLQIFSSSFCKTPLSGTISTYTRFWENVLDEKETITKQLKFDSRDHHSCFLKCQPSFFI